MYFRRIVSLLLAFALCGMAMLTGCGGTTASESVSTASVTGDTSSEHEPVTIMDAQRDYRELIKLVYEKYPEINIEVLPYRGRNMSAFCKQQLETGYLPDIYSTTQAWDDELQTKYLVDLSKYHVSELYNTARLRGYVIDGGVYLLPFDFSITGILCNKSLLERSGIAVPQSFAELRDVTVPALKEKGITVAQCLLDLPGSAFQYFFNASSTVFMNTASGIEWRSDFIDSDSDTWASDNENLQKCVDSLQGYIDLGMITYNENSAVYTDVLNTFTAGNTAFLVGTVKRFTQNEDGTGDRYVLMPWLSEDGSENTYITSPTRLYGLSKTLEEPGSEQKLEDALHVLEVLSTNEGYVAVNGDSSTNMCSIAGFTLSDDSPYYEAAQAVGHGFAMNQVYTGWDNYLVPFGEAVRSWISGDSTGEEALAALDATKRELRTQGTTYYATCTEMLDTVQAAQLSGQMFLEATGADAALISYNVYSSEVHALMENSYGANGVVLPGNMSEEYITIFLPTGWYDTLKTGEYTGSEIMQMLAEGTDTRGTGFKYPYVLMTANGEALADGETYTVVFAGVDKANENVTDTGIVGLDAAKAYLQKVGTVSTATLDNSLVQGITPTAE